MVEVAAEGPDYVGGLTMNNVLALILLYVAVIFLVLGCILWVYSILWDFIDDYEDDDDV